LSAVSEVDESALCVVVVARGGKAIVAVVKTLHTPEKIFEDMLSVLGTHHHVVQVGDSRGECLIEAKWDVSTGSGVEVSLHGEVGQAFRPRSLWLWSNPGAVVLEEPCVSGGAMYVHCPTVRCVGANVCIRGPDGEGVVATHGTRGSVIHVQVASLVKENGALAIVVLRWLQLHERTGASLKVLSEAPNAVIVPHEPFGLVSRMGVIRHGETSVP